MVAIWQQVTHQALLPLSRLWVKVAIELIACNRLGVDRTEDLHNNDKPTRWPCGGAAATKHHTPATLRGAKVPKVLHNPCIHQRHRHINLTVFSLLSFWAFISVRQMAVLPQPAGPSKNTDHRTSKISRSWEIFRQKVSSGW